jgi:hypothetical protein
MDLQSLLAEVVRIAPTLHTAGTFSARTLEAIVKHAAAAPVAHSMETGSGASTLLFSHLSADHTVFALDAGTNSIRGIEHSNLLRANTVTFVEGPTQQTLPRHHFANPLQMALIDGPHGYPFPDLEYYYIYPHLDRRALLIVDDIHIPTITNLFDFLRSDDMFVLDEVVETTAFFRRTEAPTFSPIGDGWWEQGYNRRAFETNVAQPAVSPPTTAAGTTPWYLDQFAAVVDPMRVGNLVIRRTEDLQLQGWAIDERRRCPAAAVDLVLDGSVYRTRVGIPRADVAGTYNDHRFFRCGFSTTLPAAALPPGSHELEIRIVAVGEQEYYPGTLLRFEVA